MKGYKFFFLLIGIAFSVWAYNIGGVFAVLGVYASGYAIFQLLTQDKHWIPVGDIALVMGAWQWIISSLISYTLPVVLYPMSQECDEYMMYTVPMYGCFLFAFNYYRKQFMIRIDGLQAACLKIDRIADIFIVSGLLCLLVPSMLLIAQILTFGSQLFYIGFMIKMIGRPQSAMKYMIIPLFIALLLSISQGMFHNLMVWGLFYLVVWFNITKAGIKRKLIIFAAAFLFINTLQVIKVAYRQIIWSDNYSGNKVELFYNLLINNSENENTDETNSRYNQGWIISCIYDNVPHNHDYFYGRTFKDAAISSLLPRILVPNKKGTGEQSRIDFMEMTGRKLTTQTSMGLSILGEAYGNFGFFGGAIFMFFWGWLIAWLLRVVNKWAVKYSFIWLLMIPIIFFNIIKAEISMMSVLNWTIKGFVFVFIVYLYFRRTLPKIQR